MLKKYIEKLVREEVRKLYCDYDIISSLVRKANKSKDLQAELQITKDGPWIRVNTTPLREEKPIVYTLKPEDL